MLGLIGLFWQLALVCYSSILYLCLFTKMRACLLNEIATNSMTVLHCRSDGRIPLDLHRLTLWAATTAPGPIMTGQDPISRSRYYSTSNRPNSKMVQVRATVTLADR